ncbi:MAG: hypothetical protein HY979_02710 [Candidatus Magasanikbacteria bacterium]|nr:hypothetical protein [Candidatus Magasanikbacteria bacterium]
MNLIYNEKKLKALIAKMATDGPGKLHILTDFDRTLSEASVIDGKTVGSIIGLLRAGHYLTPQYSAESFALFEKYHPLENDQTIPRVERMNKMEEWWKKHNDLLIQSKLNKRDMDNAMIAGHLKLREGVVESFKLLQKNNVPVVIMSGGPAYMIQKQLELSGILTENVHIVANYYEYDADGYMINYKKPIIHSQNKYEIILRKFPFFAQLKERTNVVLLGDQIDDLGMIEGFDYSNLLTIVFANKKEREEQFADKFNVVIGGDGDFNFVNNILKQILC